MRGTSLEGEWRGCRVRRARGREGGGRGGILSANPFSGTHNAKLHDSCDTECLRSEKRLVRLTF